MITAAPANWFVDLPTRLKRAVDKVCTEFERAPEPRRIEDYLPKVPDDLRGALLAELVSLEVENRRAAGESPTAAEYAARFPDLPAAVRAGFWQAAGPNVGGTLGKYRLTGVLGRGGMGVVYDAEDPVIGRRVAVKVLPDRWLADPLARTRLLQEARLAGQLLHPNVVALFEVGEADGVTFLVLERVAGGSAADRLTKAGPFEWKAATGIAIDVCRGLAAIHAAGFLHLDIKPANILLPALPADGASDTAGGIVAKLSDFSLAMTGDTPDRAGVTAGTPAYMSPEQRAGGAVSRKTDVYGLGAAYFALLTGRAPFAGTTVTEVMAATVRGPAPDPREFNPAVPDAVAKIVVRAMASDPKDRHPSADAVLADLLVVAGVGPAPNRSSRWAIGGMAAGLAAAGLIAVATWPAPEAPPDGARAPVVAEKIDTWEPLFDGHDFAGWHPIDFKLPADAPKAEFSIVEIEGSPTLRASGEGIVALETDREFENYHLRFEYRWGTAAGIHLASVRYHCTGEYGAHGTHGMELHFRQAGSYLRNNDLLKLRLGRIEGGTVIPTVPAGRSIPQQLKREAPVGRWNRAALVCVNDWAVHVLNGVPVLALAESRKVTADGDVPLTKGRIRFQMRRGEIFFRKIEIRRATELPDEYREENIAPEPPPTVRTPATSSRSVRPSTRR